MYVPRYILKYATVLGWISFTLLVCMCDILSLVCKLVGSALLISDRGPATPGRIVFPVYHSPEKCGRQPIPFMLPEQGKWAVWIGVLS